MPTDPVKESICPLCGKLLGTSQLVQLNGTLRMLLDAKPSTWQTVKERTDLIASITKEIERVSRQLLPEPCQVKVEAP